MNALSSEPGPPRSGAVLKPKPNDVLQPVGEGRAAKLELPSVAAFLSAPLPVPRPERYKSFAQASRLLVGRSHLFGVDLFPGEEFLLALSDDEATVRVYERRSARLVGNYAVPGFGRFQTGGALAWPEAPPRFVASSSEGLFLYDARTGSVLEAPSREKLDALRWSPDRRVLVARSLRQGPEAAGTLHFFAREAQAGAPSSLRALGKLDFSERIDAWDVSPDNRLLAMATYPSGQLVVVDLHKGVELFRIPGPDYGGDVAFSPNGRLVAMGGQGLLLVDLLNPARRAFYSHFDNNVGHVRFSPSGDALVASSYDGRVRIFRYDAAERNGRLGLALSLVQTLRHDGQANVYSFVFETGGDGVVSASGDQTVRTFRAPKVTNAQPAAPAETFRTLEAWGRLAPAGERSFPPAPAPSLRDGHYHPPRLDGAPRPSRIRPGLYACKVDLMYKLRDCWVTQNAQGHTLLKFAPDNLLALEGVLFDDGPVVRFEGWLAEPSTVVGCDGCEKQPLHALYRGSGNRFQGVLAFRNYYDAYVPPEPPPADTKLETSDDSFPLVLEFRGPLPGGSAGTMTTRRP